MLPYSSFSTLKNKVVQTVNKVCQKFDLGDTRKFKIVRGSFAHCTTDTV